MVTGSQGLVGSALQQVVAESASPHRFVFLTRTDGDLTQAADIQRLFETHRPDVLIHLAANVGGLFKNMHQKAEMLEDNVLMNTLMFHYARRYKVKKIIAMLSTCVFPDGIEPLTEDALHKGAPHPSNEGYAYAKRMMEVHARILSDQFQIQTICLSPTNVYGQHDNFNLDNAHVVPALIHRCYLAKEANAPFVVKGSGKPLRQFIYSLDLAKVILLALDAPMTGSAAHWICSPPSSHEVSIESVARKIARTMDYEHALVFDTLFADGQYKKTVEPNPVLLESGMLFTEIDVGLQQTVEWFLERMKVGGARV